MFDMLDFITELLEKYKPEEVIIEEPFAKVNLHVFEVLCEFFGMVLYVCHERNIKTTTYTAAVWRSVLGLKGKNRKEQKENAINYVKDAFQIECTDDEAEAILIGYSHIKREQNSE